MARDIITWALYYVAAPILILLTLVAIAVNGTVLLSRCHVKTRSSSLEFAYSLVANDMLCSVALAASLFWNSFGPVVLGIRHDSWCLSMALEAFRMGIILTGVFQFAALAFGHYLQIVHPLDHMHILPHRKAQWLVVFLWIVPSLAITAYFWSFPGAGFRAEKCLNSEPGGLYFFYNIYFRATYCFITLAVMVAACVIYCRLWKIVEMIRQRDMIVRHQDDRKANNFSPLIGKHRDNGELGSGNRDRHTFITGSIICGIFLFGLMPALCLFIITADGMPLSNNTQSWFGIIFFASSMCIVLKTLISPLIYTARIPDIGDAVRRLLHIGHIDSDRIEEEIK